MRHFADQTLGCSSWQSRIRVQRDHVAYVGRRDREGTSDRDESRVGGAAKPAIQLMQLTAFTLPPDPFALSLIPHSAAMQQKKPRTVRRRSVTPVQVSDAVCRRA